MLIAFNRCIAILFILAIFAGSSCSPVRTSKNSDIFPPKRVESYQEVRKSDALMEIWIKNAETIYVYSRSAYINVDNDTLYLFSKLNPKPLRAIPVYDIEGFLVNRNWALKRILLWSVMEALDLIFWY